MLNAETRTEEGRAHLSLPSNNSPNQRPPPGSKMGEKFHHDDAKREQVDAIAFNFSCAFLDIF